MDEFVIDDLKNAQDAVALFLPGYKTAHMTHYLVYGSLMLPIELAEHVITYLQDRVADLSPTEESKKGGE